jgi:succinate dehydrogenase/fumarate reductase flavoprotein subunit
VAPGRTTVVQKAAMAVSDCGIESTEEGLRKAISRIRELRTEFWSDVRITGVNEELNQTLERAGRVADFLELGELMCIDALHRRESCGGHFRAESQTENGEAPGSLLGYFSRRGCRMQTVRRPSAEQRHRRGPALVGRRETHVR